MNGSSSFSFSLQMTRRAGAGFGLLLAVTLAAAAQNAQPAQPPQPAPPAYQPGMLESVTRWFRDGFNNMSSGVEKAKDTMTGLGTRAGDAAKGAANATKDAASAAGNAATAATNAATGAAKDAADAMVRLPGSRVIEGRARCDLAPNGAPDCNHAAEAVCRAKGFTSGSSLNITTARECPTEAYLRRETRDCKVASFVTQAMCQ